MGANAETVRAWIGAFNRQDVDALLEGASPEAEWVVAREHPAAATHRGPEAIASYLRDWQTMMPGLTYEVDEIAECGEWVLVIGRIHGTGAESGAAIGVPTGTLTRFRDGVALRIEEYLDPTEAKTEFERRTADSA